MKFKLVALINMAGCDEKRLELSGSYGLQPDEAIAQTPILNLWVQTVIDTEQEVVEKSEVQEAVVKGRKYFYFAGNLIDIYYRPIEG